MRTYGKVKIAFWEDDKIRGLPDAPKLLALYCLTGEHSNAIGCFRLPLGYIETDLRWSKDTAQTALERLDAAQQRINVLRYAVRHVSPALDQAYGTLSPQQKQRFSSMVG